MGMSGAVKEIENAKVFVEVGFVGAVFETAGEGSGGAAFDIKAVEFDGCFAAGHLRRPHLLFDEETLIQEIWKRNNYFQNNLEQEKIPIKAKK